MVKAITVPDIGKNVEAGIVVVIHISAGDAIAVGDAVIELETDKALVEIPSPFSGRITEVLAEVGALMNVGEVIAWLETDGDAAAKMEAGMVSNTTDPSRGAASRSQPESREVSAATQSFEATDDSSDSPNPEEPELPDFSRWGEIEIEAMETVRRLTASKAAMSWTAIPHVTQFDEADISEVMARIENFSAVADNDGPRLTITAVVTQICAQALKQFPRFNASIDVVGNRIILKHYVHIGIATDTPRGLLVPVIRNADEKSLLELAAAVEDLTVRARNKKVTSDELEGGTFSISNQGCIGGVGFTPIVMWPQTAILGVSRSTVKPLYDGTRFQPRTILPLSLSYDHRVIDGADAARFLRWICDRLSQPCDPFPAG